MKKRRFNVNPLELVSNKFNQEENKNQFNNFEYKNLEHSR